MVTKAVLLLSILLLFFYATSVSALEVAISIDDAPRSDGQMFKGRERTDHIIKTLSDEKVKAVFFINSDDWTADTRDRVTSYSEAGQLIANHTSHHPDYHKVGLAEFVAQLDKADNNLRNLKTFRPWFRFPYLHEGADADQIAQGRQALQSRGYKNGYVTADTNDWYFDKKLQEALSSGASVDWAKLKRAYFSHLFDQLTAYDELAMKTLGRSPRHIILLHENDLNARLLKDLLAEMKQNGWTIISPDKAYSDNLSQLATSSIYNNNGIIANIADGNSVHSKYRTKWDDYKFIDDLLLQEGVFKKKASK